MARCKVYLIPAPIGDHFTDFSFAGLRAIERLEHLFVEADDAFLERMRARGLITERHQVYLLGDTDGCVTQAAALVEAGSSFGILASSGIPCFVDPGHQVVAQLLDHHLPQMEFVPVGMSSALDAALAMSGRDIQRFIFGGHAPECYTLDDAILAPGLPLIYFVRGPGIRALLNELRTLGAAAGRVLLFKDIRKKSRFTVTVLPNATPPKGLVESDDADYVMVILPPNSHR
jgi:16S rRNA C1402 (ribose-2'-O) methylase RsmI